MGGKVISKLTKIISLWGSKEMRSAGWLLYRIRWSKGSYASESMRGSQLDASSTGCSIVRHVPVGTQKLCWGAPWHSCVCRAPTDWAELFVRVVWWPPHGSEVSWSKDTMQTVVMVSRTLTNCLNIAVIRVGSWLSTWKELGSSYLVGRWSMYGID